MRSALKSILIVAVLTRTLSGHEALGATGEPTRTTVPCDHDCDETSRPWIALTFAGKGWTSRTIQTVLGDLRADLASRQIELDLAGEPNSRTEAPIASIRISNEGPHAILTQIDIVEEGVARRLSRLTALDSVPRDGRPLAIALTTDELLRTGWVQTVLQRHTTAKAAKADKIASSPAAPAPAARQPPQAPPSQPSPTPTTPPLSPGRTPVSQRPRTTPQPPAPSPQPRPPQLAQSSQPSQPSPRPDPAHLPTQPQPPPSAEQRPPTEPTVVNLPAAPAVTPERFHLGITVGGIFEAAPPTGTKNTPMAAGIAFRCALTGRWLGASLGATLPRAETLNLGDATAREQRIAFDGGARLMMWRGKSMALGADLGILLLFRRIDGSGLIRNTGASGVDVGGRAGVAVSFGSRVAPWIGLTAEIVPVPAAISFAPAGVAGHAPMLWAGIAAGFRIALLGRSSEP